MGRSIKWLFVYGTLLSRSRDQIGNDMRRDLHKHSLERCPARVPGLLYDLGGYPGWIEQTGSNNWVYGEVLRLNEPTRVFSWLDPYENIDPLHPEDGEYARVTQHVVTLAGEQVRSWVYAYRGDLASRRRIQSGRWLATPRGRGMD